jgi:chorismate mutase
MKLNLNIQPLNTWLNLSKEPLVIAGPAAPKPKIS